MKPVRILHIIDGLGGGGSERWIWDIVRLTPPKDYEYQVVTIYPDQGDFYYSANLQSKGAYRVSKRKGFLFVVNKIICHLQPRPFLLPLQKMFSFVWLIGCYGSAAWRIIKAYLQFKPDVIHGHTFWGFVAAVMLKKVSHCPMVHTVPALFSQMHDAGYGWMPSQYSRYHPMIDHFFTGASLTDLQDIGIPSMKVTWIKGVIDFEEFRTVLKEREWYCQNVREKLGLRADAKILLSVGRLHHSKGHRYALEALPFVLREFPDTHWILLGEGGERNALLEQADQLGIANKVHLMGFQKEIFPYYMASNIYLRTNLFESENLSSYMAMAGGLPVVGFDTGCETELIVKAGHGFLVAPEDAKSLADHINAILLSPDCGFEMGRRGADYCEKNLDISQTISEFCSMYTRLKHEKQTTA